MYTTLSLLVTNCWNSVPAVATVLMGTCDESFTPVVLKGVARVLEVIHLTSQQGKVLVPKPASLTLGVPGG